MSNNVSEVIKDRLIENKVRFWANDNIANFISDSEKEQLVDELTDKFEGVLDSLIIDINTDPNSMDTARRLAKMYVYEIMSGRYTQRPDVTSFPNNDVYNADKSMLVVRSEIKSICSHHHQPVYGVAYIGVLACDRLIGLSKYTRLAQWCAKRGSLQEELCVDICTEIMKATNSIDVGVYLECKHGCCENRGIMAKSSLTQTCVLKGAFLNNPGTKREFYDNISLQRSYKE